MSKVVKVEVGGQIYPIRSTLDAKYVGELAAYVDTKLRAASDAAPSSDMLGLAILVALNIADEYFRARDQHSTVHGALNARALELEQLVDDAIAQVEASKAVNQS